MRTLAACILAGTALAAQAPSRTAPLGPVTLVSPNGSLSITVAGAGPPARATWRYRVERRDEPRAVEMIAWSPLGLTRDDEEFTSLRLVGASAATTIGERYAMPHGKRRTISWRARERTLSFETPGRRRMELVLRAFDDGVAFRYRFPGPSTEPRTVIRENTGFTVPKGARGWMLPHQQPGKWSPAYEDFFSEVDAGTGAPTEAGWAYPALFRLPDERHWILVTEAGLDETYCGTHLATGDGTTYHVRFPDPREGLGTGAVEPTSRLPWATPWRVILAANGLAPIFESTLVSDVSPPTTLKDTEWVRPGRASFGWWKDDDASKKEPVLKAFIDLASTMKWEYSLIDANWHLLPDGALERVIQYAKEKNVGIFLWYNSGGPHNEVTEWGPRDRIFDPAQRRAEFARIAALGVKGVKVDFWHSDKQQLIGLYHDMMRDAAAARLLIGFHGSTIPRGWTRTWPNLLSMEGVFAAEQYKYQAKMGERGAWHNTVLPFTRNIIGPMDYTPVTLSDAQYPHQTTYAHELALPVTFESGIVHFADDQEAYGALPDAARQFLRDVPAAWDESRLLEGDPGRLALIARRGGEEWWVGAISGIGEIQTVGVDLTFLGQGLYEGLIIRDGGASRHVLTEAAELRSNDRLNIQLLPRGGFALRLTPQPRSRPNGH